MTNDFSAGSLKIRNTSFVSSYPKWMKCSDLQISYYASKKYSESVPE